MKANETKVDFNYLYGKKDLKFKNVSIDQYGRGYYAQMKGVSSVVRQFVKQVFPEVGKFQISSDSFSGGDSVKIFLNDVDEELYTKVKRTLQSAFERGNFNGMIDMYEYKEDYGIRYEIDDSVVKFSTKYMSVQNKPKFGTKAWKEYLAKQEAA